MGIRILAEVSVDVADAANWYDRNGYLGLGDRFETTFYAYVDQLQDKGQIYRAVYSEFPAFISSHFRMPFTTDITVSFLWYRWSFMPHVIRSECERCYGAGADEKPNKRASGKGGITPLFHAGPRLPRPA